VLTSESGDSHLPNDRDAPRGSRNLLDSVEATLRAVDAERFRVVPVLRQGDAADAAAIALRPDLAARALEALRADPAIASVEQDGQRFELLFADERVAATGAALEAAGGAGNGDSWGATAAAAGLETGDLRAGMRAIVDFCDPNATKALHVGHLRNIALGEAAASALAAAGASVVRESHIGDAGRSMGEAMAGYRRYAEPSTPQEAGLKSDHFVGELYARYVREEGTAADVAEEDAPVAHDLDERKDLAQELLSGVEQGDPEATELWRRVRGWAVAGQDETLARLGVHFDCVLYDSDRTAATAEVARLGIERGVFIREERGTVAYRTGHSEYPVMPLTRADGFPTHHLRVVAMWRDMMIEEEGTELIHLSGDEWEAHVHHVEELLGKLEPGRRVLPSRHILHGMVVAADESGELSSSKGTAQLIDTLLDELAARPEVKTVAREDRPGVGADDLVAIAVLGFCLDKPVAKGLTLPPAEELIDPEANTGWKIALAWAKAWDPANDGSPDPAPEDSDYRHIVLQSQLHRRNLAVALDGDLDLLKYVRYVRHLSDWYLEREGADPRIGRVMRAILASGLGTLGLLRERSGVWEPGSGERAAGGGALPPTAEHVLNEVDTYGPAFMRVAAALGSYDTTAEDAAATIELLGLRPGTKVVDAGCGFGRFCAALQELGMETTGIDISPAVLAEAEKRAPGPRYLLHDLTQPLPDGLGPFDVLVNVYSSFGYGATEVEDLAMLRVFHGLLKPGGRIVMQLSDLERSRFRLRTDEGVVVRETNGVIETLDVDFSTGRLHVRYELGDDVVHSRIRMYEREDLERMLAEVSFTDIRSYGDFNGAPKRPEDRLVLVARA